MQSNWNIFYHRKLKNRSYQVRMILILSYLLLLAIFLPRSQKTNFDFEVGQPWRDSDLFAPFSFSIRKSVDSIQNEKDIVERNVRNIFVLDTNSMKASYREAEQELGQLFTNLQRYREAKRAKNNSTLRALNNEYFRNLGDYDPEQLIRRVRREDQITMGKAISEVLDTAFQTGVINEALSDSTGNFISLRFKAGEERIAAVPNVLTVDRLQDFVSSQLTLKQEPERKIASDIARNNIFPNYIFSPELTEAEKERLKGLVLPVYGKVNRNQLLIRKGERIDKETADILFSLGLERENRFGTRRSWSVFLSQFLLVFLITLLLLAYLSVNRPRIYFDNKKFGLILTIFLVLLGLMTLTNRLTEVAFRINEVLPQNIYLSYIYLVPACLVPIFISNFFEHRTGFLCNILIALYAGVLLQQGLEYVFVQIMAGSVAVYSMRRLRNRQRFFFTLGYIFTAYALSFIAIELYSKGNFWDINYGTILLFLINVVFTAVGYNLIFLLEKLFGITSDLTYLELLDPNHTLQQSLYRKAPGTFQHSLQVANIAEAAVNVIGGNTLLTHVGALYHDIGKMDNPSYFIENAQHNGDNPHQKLESERSAQVIIDHVQKGVEIAHRHNLPREIIDFIETHHGTTRVEYFYRMYKKDHTEHEVEEEEPNFRYKGPIPFSKETAVLMIADSIEAASRAMQKPTPEDLKKLVDNIIDYKIADNQLDNSNLTFKDVRAVREEIYKQLLSIYHARIEYPEEEKKEEKVVNSTE